MAADVVCILDSSLRQVLATARPIKAVVKEEAEAMRHPLETGAKVIDHIVIQPITLELSLILSGDEYRQTYQTARELFHRGELLTVQTRTGSYPSMCITALPHEEGPDMYDATALALTLTEVQIVEAQFSDAKVSNPADAKTVKRGQQQAPAPSSSERRGSILSGVFR